MENLKDIVKYEIFNKKLLWVNRNMIRIFKEYVDW